MEQKIHPDKDYSSLEKINVSVVKDMKTGSLIIAKRIASVIKEKQKQGKNCVLGLATGSSPKSVYKELVRMHKDEELSFRNVITFNLDEYFPISYDAPQSYYSYMHRHLFDHIDITPSNINIPGCHLKKEDIKVVSRKFEDKIAKLGGVDLQILGIGSNGHIGFNEPGSSIYSGTRLVTLQNSTRHANACEFDAFSDVPRTAITMGISTILRSKEIILMAWGHRKANIVQKAVEEDVTESVPASFLQMHENVKFVIDEESASKLTRVISPWLIGSYDWCRDSLKKAVITMALRLEKTILNLTYQDYIDNGLGELIAIKGDVHEINLEVYYMLQNTITGWPGGKTGLSISKHPERSIPYPKTCLIFSPHPDDDIISMGGTFQRLHDQGHNVHVAYQTSGNIAVTDEFLTRFLDFAIGFNSIAGINSSIPDNISTEVDQYLLNKKSVKVDSSIFREIKGLIRRCEAKATCNYVGIDQANIHFQDLPFYQTGTIEKLPLGEEDVRLTIDLLRKVRPHQIFCAGDFADPHGTHQICFNVVLKALNEIRSANDEWVNNCWLFLYKGAWQEWQIEEIDMAVPLSPAEILRKRFGIFIHQSQKDNVPFKGSDDREFWQRAEERNASTAKIYANLGLTQYAAMEAFVRFYF